MPQYAIILFEHETGEELPPEVLEAHGRVPDRVKELGGEIVAGFATQPTSTATTVKNDLVTDGPFIESREAMAGFFVVEAPDLDVALEIAKVVPIQDGAVEVRPLLAE